MIVLGGTLEFLNGSWAWLQHAPTWSNIIEVQHGSRVEQASKTRHVRGRDFVLVSVSRQMSSLTSRVSGDD